MKKLVSGLVGFIGVLFGFVGIGCQPTIHEEATDIKYHSNKIRKIIKAEPGEDYQVFEFKKDEPFSIIVLGKDATRSIVYFDLNKDGKYDYKRTLEKFNNLDIRILPPTKPDLEKYRDDYSPEKRKKRLLVFYDRAN